MKNFSRRKFLKQTATIAASATLAQPLLSLANPITPAKTTQINPKGFFTIARQNGLDEVATYTLGDSVDYEPYEATRRFYFRCGFEITQRNRTDNPNCPEEIRIRKTVLP